jgi:SRSO17 transposase
VYSTDELPPAPVLVDAGYGKFTAFRDALTERQMPYVMGIACETTVWPPGMEPLPPLPWTGKGRPPSRTRRNYRQRPAPVLDLAKHAPQKWRIERDYQELKGSFGLDHY